MGKTQIALLRLRPRAFKAQAGVMGGGRWGYRGEDGGRGSSHLSGVQGLFWASLAHGKRCTQLNPRQEARLQGQGESAAWVLRSSAGFTADQRGPEGLSVDHGLGERHI